MMMMINFFKKGKGKSHALVNIPAPVRRVPVTKSWWKNLFQVGKGAGSSNKAPARARLGWKYRLGGGGEQSML